MSKFKNISVKASLLCTAIMAIGCGQKADNLTMVVGTYTLDGTSCGIYTYKFDQNSGKATVLDSVATQNPSYLTISQDQSHIYAVSEMSDSTASLNDFLFQAKTGTLTPNGSYRTLGEDPCYVSENGKIALTANYSGGSLTTFPIATDGSLKEANNLIFGSIGGPSERQTTPHVHCACFSPDGKYVFASDFSSDSLLRFTIVKDSLSSKKGFALEPEYGPRHIIFDQSSKYIYVIGELSGAVTVFSYNNGELKSEQVIKAEEVEAKGAADIHLSPDGKYLYASCRLQNDGIAIFKVDPVKGTLAKVGYQHTGKHPRNFAITPNGKYLLAACRDSKVIQVFKIDNNTGLLTDTHNDIRIDKPVCIKFAQVK